MVEYRRSTHSLVGETKYKVSEVNKGWNKKNKQKQVDQWHSRKVQRGKDIFSSIQDIVDQRRQI